MSDKQKKPAIQKIVTRAGIGIKGKHVASGSVLKVGEKGDVTLHEARRMIHHNKAFDFESATKETVDALKKAGAVGDEGKGKGK